MKKIILIFLVIFYGCNSNENQIEIENIEMMSYYYKPSENYETQILDYLHYSIIDENGKAETIKKVDNSGKKYIEFRSLVDKNILKEPVGCN